MRRGEVDGACAARFAGVRAAFADLFASEQDVGASVALSLDADLVVDLVLGMPLRFGEGTRGDARAFTLVRAAYAALAA